MSNNVKEKWKSVDAVCFDVDSTVVINEGIDELAAFLNRSEEVTKITNEAMSGSMLFQDALRLRLNVINPTENDMKKFNENNPPQITKNFRGLVNKLKKRNVPIFLVTGGLEKLINPIANEVGIDMDNVFCNKIIFDKNGNYKTFDDNRPTSQSGGKAKVCGMLKDKFFFKNLFMVGDGMTDMEACPPADAFIGFGGNRVREGVKQKSLWYVTSFEELENNL